MGSHARVYGLLLKHKHLNVWGIFRRAEVAVIWIVRNQPDLSRLKKIN